jgi:hypothetical protein
MHIPSAAVKSRLLAVCLMMLCGSTEAADDCLVADVLSISCSSAHREDQRSAAS